jgi:signal peptidase II
MTKTHAEQVSLYEELAVARATACEALALAQPLFDEKLSKDLNPETRALMVTTLNSAMSNVKELVLAVLEPGRYVPLLGPSVGWQLVFNPGASFGVRLPTVIVPLVTLLLVVIVVRALSTPIGMRSDVAQGLVLGGAIGTLVDRLVRDGDGSAIGGYVVDFVAWGTFPRFNVADACITVGVVLFVLFTLLDERAERRAGSSTEGHTR